MTCNDPQKNVGQNGGKPRLDLNVESAWRQGYTGKNVTTAIMDDGKVVVVVVVMVIGRYEIVEERYKWWLVMEVVVLTKSV